MNSLIDRSDLVRDLTHAHLDAHSRNWRRIRDSLADRLAEAGFSEESDRLAYAADVHTFRRIAARMVADAFQ